MDLKFIFEKLFSVKWGMGYPKHREMSQQKSRKMLELISDKTHMEFGQILERIDESIIQKVLSFPGVTNFLDIEGLHDAGLRRIIKKHCEKIRQ